MWRTNEHNFTDQGTAQTTTLSVSREVEIATRERWRSHLQHRRLKPLPRGADAAYDAIVGYFACRIPRTNRLLRRADRVCALEAEIAGLDSKGLIDQADRLRELFRRRRETTDHTDRAMAIVREAARRRLGLFPYRVQVAAGLGLFTGHLVEMATGEGKTLAATLPGVLMAWRGRGVHVITANDYLARRDAEEMGPLYQMFGLTVAAIQQDTPPEERRQAYAADITYCTNKEVAADFLRDRLIARGPGSAHGLNTQLLNQLSRSSGTGRAEAASGGAASGGGGVQRGLEFAIIDEADSILIDEAVTPLIIAGKDPAADTTGQLERFRRAMDLAKQLRPDRDFKIDRKFRDTTVTSAGKKRLQKIDDNTMFGARLREELVSQALTAEHLFLRDEHYVIQEEKIVIVDESTGRLMPDRTWRFGLHQAIEVKEGLEPSPADITLASISFQRFFRLYRHLSGMTGTGWEARQELRTIYRLPTVRVPTHKPCIRKRLSTAICKTIPEKFDRMIEEIKTVHATGQPVLIGTRDVDASEAISHRLEGLGLEHQVLNAVQHEHEAKVVTGAGQRGMITVATNMAGRGTDIKLGPGVAELGGLYVLVAEFNLARRIDRQLIGRAARQGDPGHCRVYASLDDQLLERHSRSSASRLLGRLLGTRLRLHRAQRRAERLAFAQRKNVLHQDHWTEESLGFSPSDH